MEIKIDSVILKNYNEMFAIYESLVDLFNRSNVELVILDSEIDTDSYYYIKSHRSSVTEGNTTTEGEFTRLVFEIVNDNTNYVVPKKAHDETYEITNLKKVYDYLQASKQYNRVVLQRAHAIIGEDIYKNDLLIHRGRLKNKNNYVPFYYEGSLYLKYFSKVEHVKNELDNLFSSWKKLADDSPGEIFAKFVILQLEVISIHPFDDGNGRVARGFSESYIESMGFIPYMPYSREYKKVYQDEMGTFSVMSQRSIEDAYIAFATFILKSYQENVEEVIQTIEKLSESMDIIVS